MGVNSFIQIGNSDDRLTQRQWAKFVGDMRTLLTVAWRGRLQVHGEWFSGPDQPWQNANWCVEILPPLWWARASEQAGQEHPSALPQAIVARDAEMHENRLQLKEQVRTLCRRYSQDTFAWTSGTEELVATGYAAPTPPERARPVMGVPMPQVSEEGRRRREALRLAAQDVRRGWMDSPFPPATEKPLQQALAEGWLPTRGEESGSAPQPPASTGDGSREGAPEVVMCTKIPCLTTHATITPCLLDSPINRAWATAERRPDLKPAWREHLLYGRNEPTETPGEAVQGKPSEVDTHGV